MSRNIPDGPNPRSGFRLFGFTFRRVVVVRLQLQCRNRNCGRALDNLQRTLTPAPPQQNARSQENRITRRCDVLR